MPLDLCFCERLGLCDAGDDFGDDFGDQASQVAPIHPPQVRPQRPRHNPAVDTPHRSRSLKRRAEGFATAGARQSWFQIRSPFRQLASLRGIRAETLLSPLRATLEEETTVRSSLVVLLPGSFIKEGRNPSAQPMKSHCKAASSTSVAGHGHGGRIPPLLGGSYFR